MIPRIYFFSPEDGSGVAQISSSVAAPVSTGQSPTFWQPHSPAPPADRHELIGSYTTRRKALLELFSEESN